MTENVSQIDLSSVSSPKFDALISTSRDLFWKYGVKRVSIEEICKKASVSKMTFYKYFKNKLDLVKYVISALSEQSMQTFRGVMNEDISFEEKIRKSIDLKMKGTDELSVEFMHDIHSAADEDLREFMINHYNQNLAEILGFYIKAQKEGEIRSDIKPEFMMYFLEHMFTMAEDNTLSSLYESPQSLILELMNLFFYGILKRDQ